jgi:hypothetical protein
MPGSVAALHLSVEESRTDGVVRRVCRLAGPGGSTPALPPLLYEVAGRVLPEPIGLLDAFVPAALFPAMRRGVPLRVQGAVTRRLLVNLEELQAAWHCWRPRRYQPVPIIPDREIAGAGRPDGRAAVACTGGLASSFTLWRHATGGAGRSTRWLAAGLLVEPMEASPAGPAGRLDALLGSLGLPLIRIRTNGRAWLGESWPDARGAMLAGGLHQLNGIAAVGLLGAGERYDRLGLPCGLGPVVAPLLSGGALEIAYDGAEHGHLARIAALAEWPAALEQLVVCERNGAANCGRCPACTTTQLGFLTLDLPIPPCFPVVATTADVAALDRAPATLDPVLRELAAAPGAAGQPWQRALENALARRGRGPALRRGWATLMAGRDRRAPRSLAEAPYSTRSRTSSPETATARMASGSQTGAKIQSQDHWMAAVRRSTTSRIVTTE